MRTEAIFAEHRLCGPKYEGCYSHSTFMDHCRADGMQWPCDVDAMSPTEDLATHPVVPEFRPRTEAGRALAADYATSSKIILTHEMNARIVAVEAEAFWEGVHAKEDAIQPTRDPGPIPPEPLPDIRPFLLVVGAFFVLMFAIFMGASIGILAGLGR